MAAKIEAILFLYTKPMSIIAIAKLIDGSVEEVKKAIDEIKEARNNDTSGIHIIINDHMVELATHPEFSMLLDTVSKEEKESELTRPQLETLTIILYRGPVTQPEIEHIRGVNCTIILRNLLMRGLIIEQEGHVGLQSVYRASTQMLRELGIHEMQELPDYDTLHKNTKITRLLETLTDSV